MAKWNDIKHRGMTREQITAAKKRVENDTLKLRLTALCRSFFMGEITEKNFSRRVYAIRKLVHTEEHKDYCLAMLRRDVEAHGGKLEITIVMNGKRKLVSPY